MNAHSSPGPKGSNLGASTAALQNMLKRRWLSMKSAPDLGPYSLPPVVPHTWPSWLLMLIAVQRL
jgi:hypothetical protein